MGPITLLAQDRLVYSPSLEEPRPKKKKKKPIQTFQLNNKKTREIIYKQTIPHIRPFYRSLDGKQSHPLGVNEGIFTEKITRTTQ
jgi:hypothetical protein